jgi:hypothetical protein
MINMGSHPTPGIPLQSEHSLDKKGLQFGFIPLINQWKNVQGQNGHTSSKLGEKIKVD